MVRRSLFKKEDLDAIKKAIQESEKITSGQIVVSAVPASNHYRWVHWMWGMAGIAVVSAALLALSRAALWPFSLLEIFFYQALGALFFSSLSYLPSLLRLSVPQRLQRACVHRECLTNFVKFGLTETQDRTGILIYLSELERRVEIVADKGIHDKLGNSYWKKQADEIALGIRSNKIAEAVCRAVSEMGTVLGEHFPRKAGSTNELPDFVRTPGTPRD